jgi:type III secretory pathway component EscS
MLFAISSTTFAEAVVNLIGVLYAINMHYPKKGNKTYNFIQQILLKIPGAALPPKVLTMHEKWLKSKKM